MRSTRATLSLWRGDQFQFQQHASSSLSLKICTDVQVCVRTLNWYALAAIKTNTGPFFS